VRHRDPTAERGRWRRAFRRPRRLVQACHALAGSIAAAALGFGMVVAIGVRLHGAPAITYDATWPMSVLAQVRR